MKKLIVLFAVSAAAVGVYAGPRGCGPCHPGPGHCPPPPHYHHGYHCDGWGRGGRNFWPGFIGGVVGGAVATAVVREPTVVVQQPVVTTPVVTQPVIVTQPVVQQTVVAAPVTQVQNVWVEGRYVDTVQANGTVVRTWNPGHYEQRTVTVQ